LLDVRYPVHDDVRIAPLDVVFCERVFGGPTPDCRGTSLIRNRPPPKDNHTALGIVLL
jgi:hypothetical protein